MELTWVGHRISVKVQRKETGRRQLPASKQVHQARLSQQRQEVQNQHLLASGSRYVAPTR